MFNEEFKNSLGQQNLSKSYEDAKYGHVYDIADI